jgi:hypothetical protein
MDNNVEINYYWGDDSFHSGAKCMHTGNVPAMVQEHKPKHASVSHALVYVDGTYHSTVEVH